MEKVDILFSNLQSHEYTKFSLKPGINFILADDNNVGKSTIFKVLSVIAKAPRVNGSKIDRLIRSGCNSAYAAFKFRDERVVAWFKRGETPGAAKLFFESVSGDGDTTRHMGCPVSLLEALGIVVGENDDVINFNDADSVQLIAKNSQEADAVLTHVMLDQKVETVKKNMYDFSREISSDDKSLSSKLDAAESILSELTYMPQADDFNSEVAELEALAEICDTIEDCNCKWDNYKVTESDVEYLEFLLNLASDISPATEIVGGYDLDDFGFLTALVESAQAISDVNFMTDFTVSKTDENSIQMLYDAASVLNTAYRSVQEMDDISTKLSTLSQEISSIKKTLSESYSRVECPVKGSVYYSEQECIPCFD